MVRTFFKPLMYLIGQIVKKSGHEFLALDMFKKKEKTDCQGLVKIDKALCLGDMKLIILLGFRFRPYALG